MQSNDTTKDLAVLVAVLREQVEHLELAHDRLAELDAFNVKKMRANPAERWRREAIELRSRISVLF